MTGGDRGNRKRCSLVIAKGRGLCLALRLVDVDLAERRMSSTTYRVDETDPKQWRLSFSYVALFSGTGRQKPDDGRLPYRQRVPVDPSYLHTLLQNTAPFHENIVLVSQDTPLWRTRYLGVWMIIDYTPISTIMQSQSLQDDFGGSDCTSELRLCW